MPGATQLLGCSMFKLRQAGPGLGTDVWRGVQVQWSSGKAHREPSSHMAIGPCWPGPGGRPSRPPARIFIGAASGKHVGDVRKSESVILVMQGSARESHSCTPGVCYTSRCSGRLPAGAGRGTAVTPEGQEGSLRRGSPGLHRAGCWSTCEMAGMLSLWGRRPRAALRSVQPTGVWDRGL